MNAALNITGGTTAPGNYQQHGSGQRRGWRTPVAAGNAAHIHVVDHQSKSTPEHLPSLNGSGRSRRGRCGHVSVRQLVAWGGVLTGLGSSRMGPTSSRVGWRFNTARDFLEFHALTRAGIRPDHAVALLNTQTLPDQFACKGTVGPQVHQNRLSSVAVLDDRDRDTPKGQIIGTSVQRASTDEYDCAVRASRVCGPSLADDEPQGAHGPAGNGPGVRPSPAALDLPERERRQPQSQ